MLLVFFLIAISSMAVQSVRPWSTLNDNRPDRSTTKFHVSLTLSCNETSPFWATVQLWEKNFFRDDDVSDKVDYIVRNGGRALNHIKGELYIIDEKGSEFEPYLFLKYKCMGDRVKKTEITLDTCKKQTFCDYDEIVDLWNLPYEEEGFLDFLGGK